MHFHTGCNTAFLQTLAGLLGYKGGSSHFTAEEQELLLRTFEQHPAMTRSILKRACERAKGGNLAEILFAAQQIIQEES